MRIYDKKNFANTNMFLIKLGPEILVWAVAWNVQFEIFIVNGILFIRNTENKTFKLEHM